MKAPLVYFAYGSNLHPARLEARVGETPLLGTGVLRGARLCFHKRGRDGSAKCSVDLAARPKDEVPGAVYAVTEAQRAQLDGFEGEGCGYRRTDVEIHTTTGPLAAFTYVAMPDHIEDTLLPYDWYVSLVRQGARHFGFASAYATRLENLETVPDPDPARAAEHAALLAQIAQRGAPPHVRGSWGP